MGVPGAQRSLYVGLGGEAEALVLDTRGEAEALRENAEALFGEETEGRVASLKLLVRFARLVLDEDLR